MLVSGRGISMSKSGLQHVALCAGLGTLPAVVLFFGWALYFLVIAVIEQFTSFRPPYDQNLMLQTVRVIAGFGLVAGALAGFVQARGQFGFAQKYILLFLFGALVPLLVSVAQYRRYEKDHREFAFDSDAVTYVGRSYATELSGQANVLLAAGRVLERVVDGLNGRLSVAYLDPAGQWDQEQCRRLDLGSERDALCIRREVVQAGRGGVSVSYWPVVSVPSGSGPLRQELRIDFFLLTGRFRCEAQDSLIGGGGLNFLRHDQVAVRRLKDCLSTAARAFSANAQTVRDRIGATGDQPVMPYWYFLYASILAFVGSDFLLVQPIGFWPVSLGVGTAMFRYLYFAVLVVVFLEPLKRNAEGAAPPKADAQADTNAIVR